MATPRFDLVDVVQAIRNRRKFVLIVTLAAAVIGGVFYLVKQKKYKAEAEFLVANPLFSDKNNIYGDQRPADYFGDEDDVDRVLAIAQSDTVENAIIEQGHLPEVYHLDMNKPYERDKIRRLFKKDYDIKRTEYKDVKLYFTNKDPYVAADVANLATRLIGEAYHGFYNNNRLAVYKSLEDRAKIEDSSIAALTDTLAQMREKYGIYGIISPARYNIMLSDVKANGKSSNLAEGIEKVQNVEGIKDQMVVNRAKETMLLSQFSTGTEADEMPLLQVITKAETPVNPSGLNSYLTVIACAILGFVFSSIIVLVTTYYRALISVER